MRVFLDSNIPMYAAGRDHQFKKPSIDILQGLRLYDAFEKVVGDVLPVEHQDVTAARVLLEELGTITARDAIHVAIMRRHGMTTVYSYDRHFDLIDDLDRREP